MVVLGRSPRVSRSLCARAETKIVLAEEDTFSTALLYSGSERERAGIPLRFGAHCCCCGSGQQHPISARRGAAYRVVVREDIAAFAGKSVNDARTPYSTYASNMPVSCERVLHTLEPTVEVFTILQ